MTELNISKYVVCFVVAMGVTALVVPLVIFFAKKFQILSKIDFRRKNQKRTPLLGGVAIFIAFCASSFAVDATFTMRLALCALPIFLVGMVDDIWELPSQPKFIAQLISVVLWIGLTPEGDLLLEQIGASRTAAFLLTSFWMIGIINAVNFIDGMDGEASMTTAIAAVTMVLLTPKGSDASLAAMALTGASLGFALYNLNPARIYLGDGGSTFLGFTSAALASQLTIPSDGRSYVLVPLFIFAFPEVDACLAMIRRITSGASMFKGDHEHLHHKLQKLGLSVNRALLLICSVVAYCCFTAWFITQLKEVHTIWSAATLSTLALVSVLGAVYYTYFRLAKQVSVYSRTLMHKYIDFKERLYFDANDFFAVSFDLLPYYKDLQARGLLTVDEFVKAFGDFIAESLPGCTHKLVGSYTVLCLVAEGENINLETLQTKICEEYYKLLHHYNVVKTSEKIPFGVTFYSPSLNKLDFMKITTIEASTAPDKVSQAS